MINQLNCSWCNRDCEELTHCSTLNGCPWLCDVCIEEYSGITAVEFSDMHHEAEDLCQHCSKYICTGAEHQSKKPCPDSCECLFSVRSTFEVINDEA